MRVQRQLRSLRQLGAYRDSLLIIGSLIYFAGYAVWSLIAFRTGLGPLPVLDAQYFAAGFPPCLLIILAVSLARFADKMLLARWPGYVAASPARIRKVRHVALFFLVIALAFFVLGAAFGDSIGIDEEGIMAASIGAVILVSLLMPTEALADDMLRRARAESTITEERLRTMERRLQSMRTFEKFQKRFYIYGLPVVGSVVVLALYVTSWYIILPQALGGAQPRRAVIDIEASAVSTQTIALLSGRSRHRAPDDAESSDSGTVIQSSEVDVLFAGGDALILRSSSGGSPIVVEIPRNAVTAVVWRD